jgi:hypothetical protein
MKALGAFLIVALLSAASLAQVPAQTPGPAHNFTISNTGSEAIEHVQISPPSNNNWGDDLLGPSEVIEPGRARTFSIMSGCAQDVRVTFTDEQEQIWRGYDTCLTSLQAAATPTQPTSGPPHNFTISNATSKAIEDVEISPPSDEDWEADLLGPAEAIAPGESRTFTITRGCPQDVRVTFVDSSQREWHNLDTCGSRELKVAQTPSV